MSYYCQSIRQTLIIEYRTVYSKLFYITIVLETINFVIPGLDPLVRGTNPDPFIIKQK
jgi:hypothetical protein